MTRRLATVSAVLLGCSGAFFAFGGVLPARGDEAIGDLRALVASRPTDAALHNDLANLLQVSGSIEEAEAGYRRALELDPELVAARLNLAMLLQETGRDRAAKKELSRVVDIDPSQAWAHYQLGVLAEKKGRRGSAVDSYATAFRLDPKLTFAKNNPQIVDNKLMLEALIEAWDDAPSAQTAPRVYADPVTVGRLVADAIRAGLETETLAPAAAPSRPAESLALGGGLSSVPETGDATVLDATSLTPGGRSGQATAPVAVGGAGATRSGGGTPMGGTSIGGAPSVARPSRGGYRPGRLSTSWLDTDLVRAPAASPA